MPGAGRARDALHGLAPRGHRLGSDGTTIDRGLSEDVLDVVYFDFNVASRRTRFLRFAAAQSGPCPFIQALGILQMFIENISRLQWQIRKLLTMALDLLRCSINHVLD